MTPEQEEAVRRALAAVARADDAERPVMVPREVADRLDSALADLVAARGPTGVADAPHAQGVARSGTADELAARRRGRWPQVLVAAAAVCVIAAAGGAVVTRGLGSSANDSSAGSAASTQERTRGGQGPAQASAAPSSAAGVLAGGAPRLRSRTLRHDVQALVDARAGTADAQRVPAVPRPACKTPALSKGQQAIQVELDGRPATLVLGQRAGRTLKASVFGCSDARVPATSTTVRAR